MKCEYCSENLEEDDMFRNAYKCVNNLCTNFDALVYPKRKDTKRYNREGVQVVECYACHRDVMLSRIGKMKNNRYCEQCYLKKQEEGVKQWSMAFRYFRNGKDRLTMNDIMNAPRLSDYIN